MIHWGSEPADLISGLEKAGWIKKDETEDRVDMVMPVSDSHDAGMIKTSMDDLSPFHITAYFSKKRLSAIRFIRRDKGAVIAPFIAELKSLYDLGVPAWSSEEKISKTETGNVMHEKTFLFESEEGFARMITSTVDPSEHNLEQGMFDEVELMLFSRKENEGISLKALQDSLEKGE